MFEYRKESTATQFFYRIRFLTSNKVAKNSYFEHIH